MAMRGSEILLLKPDPNIPLLLLVVPMAAMDKGMDSVKLKGLSASVLGRGKLSSSRLQIPELNP